MKLLILAKAGKGEAMPRDGDLIEFRSDRMTDKGPATGTVKTIKPTVDGFYVTVEFADGQATLSWDDMGAERVKPGLWLVKATTIEEKYQRLLARRTDGTPEAMAAEDARLRDLVERCSGPAAVEAIRSADAEARAKVREDFGIEFASEGGYAADVIDFHGLQVVIENPVGSVRAGVDPDGKAWATELTASYGYISGTEGADGDMVDVFIGPDASSTTAYVARCQVAGKWGTYDEDKVMLGFQSEEAAREAFLQNYNDPRFLGGLDAMSIEKLKERLGKPGRLAKAVVLLSKAHISAYTRKDGTFVKEHDDKRKPLAHDHLPTDNPADHAKVSLSVGSAAHVRADRIVASKANPADKARERGFRDAMMGLPSRRHEFSKISQVSYDQGVDRAKKTRETLKGRPWMETELERDGSKWRWAVYEEGRHIASGEAKTEKAAGQAVDDARVRAAEKRASAADITKSLLIFTKAHVGPYMRQGKLVNLAGYHGRDARTQAAAGQLSLFGSNEPAGPNPYKGKHPVHDTPDLFADADEHGEVPPARVLMPRRDTVTESRQELIAEHERLVDVLRSPSHEDDKAEAKKQAAELAEYKEGEHDHLLAEIPGATWRRGKGLIAGHYGVEVGGEVLGNYHQKPEDAVAAAKEWMARNAAQKAEAEKRTENIATMQERLLAGGEATDMDLKLLGLRQGAAGLEWFIPAAAEAFGISSRAVRPYIKDMISIGHTINGVKKEFVPPKKALQAIAAAISGKTLTKSIPVLFIRSAARLRA